MLNEIRKKARELLEKREVEGVLGFTDGSLPLIYTPYLAEKPEDADNLLTGPFATVNIARYLTKLKDKKIAVIARGCETRAINMLIAENQLDRDKVVIIGVPCRGVVDRRKIEKEYGGEIYSAEICGNEIKLTGEKGEKTFKLDEFLSPSCRSCMYPEPVAYDILIKGEAREIEKNAYDDIKELEGKSPDEKWQLFTEEFSKCIRCYSCREVCPMCYCESCFVDSNKPQWVEPGFDITDILSFHLIRMYHMAGRCVDCGACERACPREIRLSLLTRKLTKDMKEAYDYVSGLSPEAKPVLGEFSPEDREDFVL